MSEKPTRVEVGQRWHSSYGSGDVTVTSVSAAGRVELSSGSWTMADDMLAKEQFTFLGAPSPCVACYPKPNQESDKLAREFLTGRRDFPRRPPMETPAAAPKVEPAPREPHPASCLMERWDEKGPRTALEAIRSRPKPEPYICPVDDWDLLPDAGR